MLTFDLFIYILILARFFSLFFSCQALPQDVD